ncbi:MAG: hypothetical protein R3F48_15640 [Candidatus Zixiibacteriota bacterium]
MLRRVLKIFGFAMTGSVLTVITFTVSMTGKVDIKFLMVPTILPIALIWGAMLGIMLTVYLYIILSKIKLKITFICVIAGAIIIVICFNKLSPRLGIIGSLLYWMVTPAIIRYITNYKKNYTVT